MADAAPEQVLFDALLTPHRSLSPRGFAILLAVAVSLGFVFGAAGQGLQASTGLGGTAGRGIELSAAAVGLGMEFVDGELLVSTSITASL